MGAEGATMTDQRTETDRLMALVGLVLVFSITGGPSGIVMAIVGLSVLLAWRDSRKERRAQEAERREQETERLAPYREMYRGALSILAAEAEDRRTPHQLTSNKRRVRRWPEPARSGGGTEPARARTMAYLDD
jgi:hypothetical protein